MFDLQLCNFIDGPIKTIQETDYIMLLTHTSDITIITFYHPLRIMIMLFNFYLNMIFEDKRLYSTTYYKTFIDNNQLTHYFL